MAVYIVPSKDSHVSSEGTPGTNIYSTYGVLDSYTKYIVGA